MKGTFVKTSDKDLNGLIAQAAQQGWVVIKTGGDHVKWVSPTGAIVFSGSTNSDKRALQNIKRELRHKGFIVKKKGTR
jgi:hypothetical protein